MTMLNRTLLISLLSALALSGHTFADGGGVHGKVRYERIKGSPEMGYIESYESNLFFCPAGPQPVGPHRRVGAPPNEPPRHNGDYGVSEMTPGRYSLIVSQPLFYVRPKILPGIRILEGKDQEQHVDLCLEYATNFRTHDQWTHAEPAWYQTFRATGLSITDVSFAPAGCGADGADVSVMEDNGEADVRKWKVLGTRRIGKVTVNSDNWVRWRSDEIPTNPGGQYAVRITGVGGDGKFQPYKRDKDERSYQHGRAFNAKGEPQGFDLNYVVFGDNDGTRVTVSKRTSGLGELKDGYFATAWGQTFVAKGGSLAGVDVWAAGAEKRWDLDFAWEVRVKGPDGPRLGPVKITHAGYQAFGCGLHGVSYDPGQVRLEPGKTYFIAFKAIDPPAESPGFNPYITDDPYDDGISYRFDGETWKPHPKDDITMTIIEYRPKDRDTE